MLLDKVTMVSFLFFSQKNAHITIQIFPEVMCTMFKISLFLYVLKFTILLVMVYILVSLLCCLVILMKDINAATMPHFFKQHHHENTNRMRCKTCWIGGATTKRCWKKYPQWNNTPLKVWLKIVIGIQLCWYDILEYMQQRHFPANA